MRTETRIAQKPLTIAWEMVSEDGDRDFDDPGYDYLHVVITGLLSHNRDILCTWTPSEGWSGLPLYRFTNEQLNELTRQAKIMWRKLQADRVAKSGDLDLSDNQSQSHKCA